MFETFGMDLDEIFNCKTWDEIKELHNNLSVRLSEIKQNNLNSLIQAKTKHFKKFETNIDKISFVLIESAEELQKESMEMKHCVSSYAESIASGNCLIFRVYDTERLERATLELSLRKKEKHTKDLYLTFNQLKAKHNNRATKRIIKTVIDFCKNIAKAEIDKFHTETGDLKSSETQKPSHYYGNNNDLF
jgi:hypothetical protein